MRTLGLLVVVIVIALGAVWLGGRIFNPDCPAGQVKLNGSCVVFGGPTPTPVVVVPQPTAVVVAPTAVVVVPTPVVVPATPVVVAPPVAPTTAPSGPVGTPAAPPASASGKIGVNDFSALGAVNCYEEEDGQLAGAQLRTNADQSAPGWIDQIHLSGKPVRVVPAGLMSTWWIIKSQRGPWVSNLNRC